MPVKWLVFLAIWADWLIAIKSDELQWHLFRQSDYMSKIHHVEAVWYNHSYLRDAKLDYALYNRTQRAFTGDGHLLVDITNDFRLDAQLYKMMSNEYRFFPITVSLDVCKEAERNSFGIQNSLIKTSNLTICPIKKGYYYIRNAVVDYSKFPPFIPHGQYKMELKFYLTVDFFGELHVYYEVSGKPLLPKF